MKIITLWQPWASFIALGLKSYETRPWATNYRGPIAIHAAKRPIKRDELLPILYATGGGGVPADKLEALNRFMAEIEQTPLGAIVAVANLANCLRVSNQFSDRRLLLPETCTLISKQTVLEQSVGDWQAGRYAWQLKDVTALPKPVPYKGAQGLRGLDPEIAKQILAKRGEI